MPAKVRQHINGILIGTGLRNPGGNERHDWVGPGYHEMKREFQINFLKSHGLSPDKTLLDLGCGTLQGGIPIIDYLDVGHYFGIDVRSRVILKAHEELAVHI